MYNQWVHFIQKHNFLFHWKACSVVISLPSACVNTDASVSVCIYFSLRNFAGKPLLWDDGALARWKPYMYSSNMPSPLPSTDSRSALILMFSHTEIFSSIHSQKRKDKFGSTFSKCRKIRVLFIHGLRYKRSKAFGILYATELCIIIHSNLPLSFTHTHTTTSQAGFH